MSRYDNAKAEYAYKVVSSLLRDEEYPQILSRTLDDENSCDEELSGVLYQALKAWNTASKDYDLRMKLQLEGGKALESEEHIELVQTIFKSFAFLTDPSAQGKSTQWKYLDWICKSYNQKKIKAEDLYKIKKDLEDFEALKGGLPNHKKAIETYLTYDELIEKLTPLQRKRDQKKEERDRRRMDPEKLKRIMDDTTLIYEGKEGKIVIPRTAESSIYWGQQTRWCTSAEHSTNFFESYNVRRPLWLYLTKPDEVDRKVYPNYFSFKYTGTQGDMYDENDRTIDYIPPHLARLINAALDNVNDRKKTYLTRYGSYSSCPFLDTENIDSWGKRRAFKKALQCSSEAMQYLSEEQRSDKNLMTLAAKTRLDALQYASNDLLSDKGFMMSMVRYNGDSLQYASDNLKRDKELVLKAIHPNTKPIEDCNFIIRPLFATLLRFLVLDPRNSAFAIAHADPALQADKDVFLKAFGQGFAPETIPDDLRKDKKIALRWVRKKLPFKSLSEEFKKEANIIRTAIYKDPSLIHEIEGANENSDLVTLALKRDGLQLKNLPDKYKTDRSFIEMAITSNGKALEFADDRFRSERNLVLKALSQNGCALEFAAPALKEDWHVVVKALANTRMAASFVPLEYRFDRTVQLAGYLSRQWRNITYPARVAILPVNYGVNVIQEKFLSPKNN